METCKSKLVDLAYAARTIRTIITGGPGSLLNEQSPDKTYWYGRELKIDGKVYNGYTLDTYSLRTRFEENYFLNFCSKETKQNFARLVEKGKYSKKNNAFVVVLRQFIPISYDGASITEASIYVGSIMGGFQLGSMRFELNNDTSLSWLAAQLKKSLTSQCTMHADNMIKKHFFSASYGFIDLVKKCNIVDTEDPPVHIGIGIHSSIKKKHVVYTEYDFKKYVRKFGVEALREWIKTASQMRVLSLSPQGVLTLNESWTDTWD